MVTSIVCIALIGTLQFNSANSAAINYEPIKITVNENFNAQPGQVFPELQEPGVLHQGANFYFKPQLNLPPSYIPSHIKDLIQQHRHSCSKDASKLVVEKDKLIEILQPFIYPMSEISKETLSEIVLEKENNLEIVKPIIITDELKPVTPGFLVPPLSFNGIPPIVEEEVKKEESVILEESPGVFPAIAEIAMRPITEPIINYVESKPITSGLVVIPEAPVLPPLSVNDIHVIEEEVKIEEPTVVEIEPKPAIQELVAIRKAPVLPSLSLHDISSIIEEEAKKEGSLIFEDQMGVFSTIPEIYVRPIEKPIINYVKPQFITSELAGIPKAPVLPSLSFNRIPPIIEEEVKKEQSIILEESIEVLPEPTIIEVEPKPFTSELVVVPEAPVLPSLSLHDISSMIKEEVKKEELIIFNKLMREFPTIPEIHEGPIIEEPIINYVEREPITSELVVIPEAPVLPPLSFNGIFPIVEEEVEKEESIILEEPTDVSPTIPEIAVRPITEPIINYVEPTPINAELVVIPEAPVQPPFSANDIHIVKEEVKIEEPIFVDVEPKPVIQELVAISEAKVSPSLSLHDISSMIEEEVKKEQLVIFEELTRAFPTIPEIDVRPIEEPIINYVEPKSITSELVVIPEMPVLPPLSYNGIPPILEEEVEKEESIILEAPTDMFPTIPEIDVRPISEPIINYEESKPINSELVAIPEVPVLPLLSANDIHVVEEEVKIEEPIVVDVEPTPINAELVAIPEVPVLPLLSANDIHVVEEEVKIEEPIVVDVEPTPINAELVAIPEVPVLPLLSANDIHVVEEEVKIEEPIVVDVEPTPINAELVAIPEVPVLPLLSANDIHVVEEEVKIEEPIFVDVESKPVIQELVAISEAPVFPSLSLSLHDISSMIEEEVKKEELVIFNKLTREFPTIPEIHEGPIIEEPIINYVEREPITSELVVIPEAPVLPPLSFNGIFPIVEEEVEKEESIILEEPTDVFPTIPEIDVRPISEPIINYVESKPINAELVVMPKAPVLASLSANDIGVVEEEVKIEEPMVFYLEPEPVIQELVAIPEAPVLPSLSLHDISFIIGEEVKKEESVIFEEPTGVFPGIPEINVRPIEEPIIYYDEPKLITSEVVVIPEAPVLPQLSYNGIPPIVEDVKIDESIKFEESTGVFPSISKISAKPFPEPLVASETAESYALENNIFPIATKEVKIEVPILFEESIQVFPPTAEVSSGPTLQESEITDSYVLEEVSQPNPGSFVTIKETLPPTIISKPSNNMGVFNYEPFVSHLSNRAPKTKKLMIPKPASVERFLLKKQPFRLPVTPFPKHDLNTIKPSLGGNKKQFLYPTSYAHDVVLPQKRIAPNMAFKKQNAPKRVKIYIGSNVPKGASYL